MLKKTLVARDHTSPREPTASVSLALTTRKDAPAWQPTSRGGRDSASRVTHSQTSRDLALQDLHRDVKVHSASGSRASTLSTWLGMHHLWFGKEVLLSL